MKMSDLYPPRFMKAEDFEEGETRILTIKNVELEELGQGKNKQEKPILSFREPDTKEMVLNKTNAATIAKLYGDDTDDWIGKKIELYTMDVESFGEMVGAIRIKTKAPKGTAAPVPTPQVPAGDDDFFVEEPTPTPVAKPNGAPAPQVGNFGPGVQTSKGATKESVIAYANAHGIGNLLGAIIKKYTRNGGTDWAAVMNDLVPQVK